MQTLLKPENLLNCAKDVQLLIQITALLRNLVASPKRHAQFVELGLIVDLTRTSAQYNFSEELQLNIARIFGKLSMHDRPCVALAADASHARQIVRCLQTHMSCAALVLRASFTLGNLCARSEELRMTVMLECGTAALLPGLLERYWRHDRKLAQAEAAIHRVVARLEVKSPSGSNSARGTSKNSDATDCEGVLTKLVRLVANAAISPVVGPQLATTAAVVDPLLDMLGCKRMPESEELVLTATVAVTNLLFYDSSENLLFSPENKQLLCRLLRPMLLESYNIEALVESARALGNISRHQDAKQWMSDLRLDEVLCILLAHDDRDLVYYCCGALVNLAAEPHAARRLCQAQGLRPKIAALLRDAPEDDPELSMVAVKVLSNLRLEEETGVGKLWPEEELQEVLAGLQRASASRPVTESVEDAERSCALVDLASQLLNALQVDD